MPPRQRTWIEVSGSALRHNLRAVQHRVGASVGIIPIIKANAYGHGTAQVMKALRREHHEGFGVAYGEEALQLRQLGYRGRIVVLSFWDPSELRRLIHNNIELVVWDWASLQHVLDLSPALRRLARVHLKLDSGTTRIGFIEEDLQHLAKLNLERQMKVMSVWSHLANAEEQTSTRTKHQLKRFATLRNKLANVAVGKDHIAATAAALRYPEARFGRIRLGIGLYGLRSSLATKSRLDGKMQLRPALTWKTRLIQVKRVPAKTAVGYGSTYITKRPTYIGILPVGYSDGYDRRLSNTGWAGLSGQSAPVVGRVSMNLMMIDLGPRSRARTGTEVTLIGPGAAADDLSNAAGVLNYELVSRLSPLIPRQLI